MNTAIWIIQCLLAAFFIMPAIGKISGNKEKHIRDGHIKAGASILPIRVLGILELLGCLGIIAPWLTGIAPILTPISALGFCFIMAAALVHHTKTRDYKMLPMLMLVFVLAALVAGYRFTGTHG